MSQDRPKVTLHVGALVDQHGRFRLREQYLLRDDGERRESNHFQVLVAPNQHEEQRITIIERELNSLPYLVYVLHRWLTSERAKIALFRNNFQVVRRLDGREPLPGDPKHGVAADEQATNSGELRGESTWQADLQKREALVEEVQRALLELEAQHPTLGEQVAHLADETAARDTQTARQRIQRLQEAYQWWLRPTVVAGRQVRVVLGDAIARYGKLRVRPRTVVLPSGQALQTGYGVSLDELDRDSHMPLLAAGTFGSPYTPRQDWDTTRHYLRQWLDEMWACIEVGRDALSSTSDPHLIEVIEQGLVERELQHKLVGTALREAEAQQDNLPDDD